jgi:hypothetical protein
VITIPLGHRAGAPNLHEFTYNDYVGGLTQLLASSRSRKAVCKVHPLHKGWIALWPIPGLAASINLSNNDPVTVFGWRIEFDWDFAQGTAQFD